MPTAMLTTFFVKLNNYYLINFGVMGAAANDGMLVFWGQRRTMGCWRFYENLAVSKGVFKLFELK